MLLINYHLKTYTLIIILLSIFSLFERSYGVEGAINRVKTQMEIEKVTLRQNHNQEMAAIRDQLQQQSEILTSVHQNLADVPGDTPAAKIVTLKQNVEAARTDLIETQEQLAAFSAVLNDESLENQRLRIMYNESEQEQRKLRNALKDSEEIIKTTCSAIDSLHLNPNDVALIRALENIGTSLREMIHIISEPNVQV
jgi:hypothetical protein